MYAVITTGGKQYRVSEGSNYRFEKLAGDAGSKITFDQVLLLGDLDGDPKVGTPLVAGALVEAEIVAQAKAPKVVIFKKKKRKGYAKKTGHRQLFTEVKITKIAS